MLQREHRRVQSVMILCADQIRSLTITVQHLFKCGGLGIYECMGVSAANVVYCHLANRLACVPKDLKFVFCF